MLEEAGLRDVGFTHAGSTEEGSITAAGLQRGVRTWTGRRVALLARDPRDTIVSFFFQATRRSRVYRGSFSGFLRHPRFGIERVIAFNLLWIRERHRFPAFLLLTYEEMHCDPHAALQKVSAFLVGGALADDEVARVVRESSFGKMRAMELSGVGAKRWGVRLRPGNREDPDSFKTRRGVVGGWRDYFSPDDEEFATDLLARYNYPECCKAWEGEIGSTRMFG